MLKPKALTEVLAQATTGGVDSTLLLSKEGVLLAYSGFGESNACISAAIASSVWSTFEKQGADVFQDQEDRLKLILSECERGRIAITKVASLLLCMITKESVPMGLLRAKMQAVADYLESPLSRLATI
jgi:predicted regulator of Ras-like GTPase activity (Roadblock/LC7/MglB family)